MIHLAHQIFTTFRGATSLIDFLPEEVQDVIKIFKSDKADVFQNNRYFPKELIANSRLETRAKKGQ